GSEIVAASIAFGMLPGDASLCMKRLMNIADEMNNESERLGPSLVIAACLQNLNIVVQGLDDVFGLGLIFWQISAVAGKRVIDIMIVVIMRKGFAALNIISPMRCIDEIL